MLDDFYKGRCQRYSFKKKCPRNYNSFLTLLSKKAPIYQFSPVTSTNVGISSQNFLTFSYNPFATLV